MRRTMTICAVLVVALSFAGGCIFEPREPEPPGGDEQICKWVTPTSPKSVFQNLACGLVAESNESYELSLSRNYVLIPRDEDRDILRANFGYDVFEDWNKERELAVVTRIKSDFPGGRDPQYGYEDGSFDYEDPATDPAEFRGPYMIILDSGSGAPPDTIAGKAIWKIENSSSGWVVLEWKDYDIIGTYPTLGYTWGLLSGGG